MMITIMIIMKTHIRAFRCLRIGLTDWISIVMMMMMTIFLTSQPGTQVAASRKRKIGVAGSAWHMDAGRSHAGKGAAGVAGRSLAHAGGAQPRKQKQHVFGRFTDGS